MERSAMEYLDNWRKKEKRKPIIVRGARQVGKTWLIKEFGKRNYKQVAYMNFESSKLLRRLFEEDYDTNRIISAIQIETGLHVEAENTLIIFDEIQEAEGGITALKYFYEDAPQYHIIAAGSLLGVALHKSTSFPVGKIDFLDLFPLSFSEFLNAMGQSKLLEVLNDKEWNLVKNFKVKYIQLLRNYYFTGGMPEAVLSFAGSGDYNEVRQIQNRILLAFEQDFSKHAPAEIVPRIRMLWSSIPSQLAKENRKFIYSVIKKGSRAKDYELALQWLIDCGLAYKITRISKPGIPLKAYEDISAFKLFTVDTGLMAAMGSINAKTLLEGNIIFAEIKGALTEQYDLHQLKPLSDDAVHFWSSSQSSGEVDFVLQYGENVVPLEVKAEENLQAKSLKSFYQKYPDMLPVRTSMSDFRKEGWLVNLPLYAIHLLTGITV